MNSSNYIDFQTNQNILLSYPKADIWLRVGAFLLDLVTVSLINSLLFLIFGTDTFAVLISTLIFFFWNLSFEIWFQGQSLGKKIVGIRIVHLDGQVPTVKTLLIRWVFKTLDILFTLGLLALYTIYATKLSQRIGDIVAGTTVVNVKVSNHVSLNNLLKLNVTTHDIKYPQVVAYSEEQMLLLKRALVQAQGHPTTENKKLLIKLSEILKNDLSLTNTKSIKPEELIKSVLQDYIIITRS